MSVIDITKRYRTYSPEELRNAAYSGIVYCGNKDLTDFLEYIFKDVNFKEDLDSLRDHAYEEGYQHGKFDCDCEDDQ